MQTIPCVLQGHNVLVSAPTGTGKTASYLVPVIAQVLLKREAEGREELLALVLAPIRELAIQIESVARFLMHGIRDMKTALVVGGFPIPTQRYRLQSGVQLIVATPGRFLDIFTNYSGGEAILLGIHTCVVDEVDMMLDVGFRPQISQIVALLATLRKERSVQILFFSATVSDEVEGLVRLVMKGQHEPTYIRVDVCSNDSKTLAATGMTSFSLNPIVEHQVRWAEDKTKKKALFDFLEGKHEESTLVFVSSKIGATMLAEAIHKRCGIYSASIHADKSQKERLALLEAFINLEISVLVSTNVLSRGMDLLHVRNVVIYDFPKKVADYVHLIGRTGRGDDGIGNALTLVNQGDRSIFREFISVLRSAKIRVPREVYQSVHSEDAQQQARFSNVVIDESKRAFRIRKQLIDEIDVPASEWKGWNSHKNAVFKRQIKRGHHSDSVTTRLK
ncbi:hypothetical protein BBO99_00002000 [Phytophthora kernoviae]|uniref:RNA helicase n=3 Tax=Phytophthora kernoviae TaxID=325452 RepID=A0A421H3X1_9STRA|nr:hypothetical protein JM16_000005 [Phytophthora kernoviae]KAG2533553.1 hypothetical protein JM18_000005 [Phytophthora kernoviae]RLN86151.1 hypothetical protein BBO99_00002000 [Phytophthora kernoviae]